MCKNTDTKNDTRKVVQKYAATKKYAEKFQGEKKSMSELCRKRGNYPENTEKCVERFFSLCGQSDADQALAQNTRRLQFILQNSHPKKR